MNVTTREEQEFMDECLDWEPDAQSEQRDFLLLDADFSQEILWLSQAAAVLHFGSGEHACATDRRFEPVEWALHSTRNFYASSTDYRILGWIEEQCQGHLIVMEFNDAQRVDDLWKSAQEEPGQTVKLWEIEVENLYDPCDPSRPSKEEVEGLLNSTQPGRPVGEVVVRVPPEFRPPAREQWRAFRSGDPALTKRLFELLDYSGPREYEVYGRRRPSRHYSNEVVVRKCEQLLADGTINSVELALDAVIGECLNDAVALVHAPKPERAPQMWRAFVVAPSWSTDQARQAVEKRVGVTGRFPAPTINWVRQVAPGMWVMQLDNPSLD